ncbi:pickpocket protein 11-like [Anopheles maculipalpis]|uniref:pickpocket protein 11-like n=1 Tax=Anopheles maculipalpis TaxID=1496333 RepID=UPI002158FAE3|nr:pickpocket protein 11-like [Anopheles maculipalpis]
MAQTYLFVSPNSNLDEDITAICAGLNSTCNLNLKVMKNRMYIHSPEDYPNFVEPFYALRKSGFVSHFMLQITETVNQPEVKDEPIDKRKCRFPEERLSPALAYSFSQCFLYNRINLELKLCNCTIPTSPKEYEKFYCDLKGLLCINKVNVKQLTKHVHTVHKDLSCMQACESLETHVIGETYNPTNVSSEAGKVILEVLNVPIFRYQRRVIRNKLDFVVSLGGIGGLFFGVSLISIIELVYNMFFKPYHLKVKFTTN